MKWVEGGRGGSDEWKKQTELRTSKNLSFIKAIKSKLLKVVVREVKGKSC